MKSMKQQTLDAAFICIGISVFFMMLSLFTGCGKQGPAGVQGAPGTNGSNCSVTTVQASGAAPNGGSLIQCTDGSQSLVLNGTNGTNRANGATGATGATGANGSNGTDGTVIAPIQFCANKTTYPTTFSEIAFCIQGNLYAVYSLNDGFLSEIPPGQYESDGVNSSCTFTVSANCMVEDN